MKQEDKLDYWIEVPGYLFAVLLFSSIWIAEYRWRLFFTSLFCIMISIVSYITKNKNGKLKLGNMEKEMGEILLK